MKVSKRYYLPSGHLRVMAIHETSIEVWDGKTLTDPDWPDEAYTQTLHVGQDHDFNEGDIVSITVKLEKTGAINE